MAFRVEEMGRIFRDTDSQVQRELEEPRNLQQNILQPLLV